MTRDERLREKFIEWMRNSLGGGRMLEEGFLDTSPGRFWLELFVAGATAQVALDLEAQAPAATGIPYVGPDLGGEG